MRKHSAGENPKGKKEIWESRELYLGIVWPGSAWGNYNEEVVVPIIIMVLSSILSSVHFLSNQISFQRLLPWDLFSQPLSIFSH